MNYWITSDLHFYHKNILRFNADTRRFANVEEMNYKLIQEWQDKVQPDDIIFDLGDFSFGSIARTKSILSQLPGKKIHIRGNHDQVIDRNREITELFDEVHSYYEMTHNGTFVVMFHYPIAEFNKMHRGAVHLHGHLHGEPSGLEKYRVRDVSWDASGGRILPLQEAIDDALRGAIKTHHN